MKKQFKLSTGILALAMMLMCNSNAMAQAEKASAPSKPAISTASGSQMRKINPATPAVARVKAASPASDLALEKEKLISSNPDVNDLQVALVRTKVMLEMGMQQNTLSPAQIKDIKAKIADIEARQALMKTKMANANTSNNEAPKSAAVLNILAAKQFSRARFLALSDLEQKQVLLNLKDLTITDLVNSTPEALKYRSSNVSYLSVEDFKNADVTRQRYILKNPASNMVALNESMIPKAQISKETFNSLSPEKQQTLMNSNKIQVVDMKPAVKQQPVNHSQISRAAFNALSPEKQKALLDTKKINIVD